MKTSFLCVVPMAMILGGCVVTPRPMAVAQPSASAGMGFEDQYSPPLEYVEGGAPVFYDAEPGVAYYPILLDTPGSCFCIVPMRYVNGVWLGVGGVVLYRGYFRFHYPTQHHRDVWVRSGGVVNGYAPMRGSVERVGNVLRPVPPPGSIHAQQLERQRAPREPGGQPQQVPYRQQPMQPQQAPNWQQANQPQHAPDRPPAADAAAAGAEPAADDAAPARPRPAAADSATAGSEPATAGPATAGAASAAGKPTAADT